MKLKCGAERHHYHYSMFNVGRSMFGVQSVRRGSSGHILLRLDAAQVVTLLSGQHGLAHAHGSGCDLHQLVFADKADALLQGR